MVKQLELDGVAGWPDPWPGRGGPVLEPQTLQEVSQQLTTPNDEEANLSNGQDKDERE